MGGSQTTGPKTRRAYARKPRPLWLRYGAAAGAVCVGWVAREALTSAVGPTALPFITFFPAVALAAWCGGFGPGIGAVVLSAAAANWFYLEPIHDFTIRTPYDVAALASFIISCLFIVGAIESMHRAKARALHELTERERLEAELARLGERFATTVGGVRQMAAAAEVPRRGPRLDTDASGARTGARPVGWSAVMLAAYALVAGGVTLAGWFAGVPRLTDWVGSGISMFPNAALGALCAGAALILAHLSARRGARLSSAAAREQVEAAAAGDSRARLFALASGFLGCVVLLLGGATLFQHVSGVNLGIDTMLVDVPWGAKAAVAPGRLGPPASTSYTLLGLALVLIATGRARTRRMVPALGILVCTIAVLALMGYVSGADPLFAVAKYTGIAPQTTTVLLALALGVLVSVPEYEPVRTFRAHNAAGLLARRSLPFIIGLPFVLGWWRVRAQEAGWFDTAMGTALLVLVLVAIFCGLLWWWVATVAGHERKLAEARDLLATTVACIGDAVIATDAKGDVLLLNAEAERLTGWKDAEARGQPLLKVFHIINEQSRQPAENPVEKVFRTGKVAGLANHTLLVAKDGTETPIDDSAAPIRASGGLLFGVVLVFRDFTERKKAEEALRSSEERLRKQTAELRAIFDTSPIGLAIAEDAQGLHIRGNPANERLLGVPPGSDLSLRGTERAAFRVRRDGQEVPVDALPMQRACRGETVQDDVVEVVRSDGATVTVYCSAAPLLDEEGQPRGAVGAFLDLTPLQRAEAAGRESEQRLAGIIQSAMDAVIAVDDTQRIVLFNPAAEQMFRCPSARALGQPLDQFIPARFREGHRAHVENFGKTGATSRRMGALGALSGIRADGEEFPIEASISHMEAGGRKLFTVILRDITERKEVEEKLRDAQRKLLLHAADLEATVAERTAKLQETVHDLQAFSYSIAHDMRAPLRAMGTFAQLLRSEISATATSPDLLTYCERIMVGAARLDNLINDALNYTKAALQEFPAQPVDLGRLLRGLLDTYPNLHAANADIRLEGNLPVVLGNESLLTQCFSNLLGNAVKFVAPGVRPRVRVRSEFDNGAARIWIEDNGIGIPKHAQPRLFAMFQKLDNQYEGTGIGLAIVRKVVERMGGKVGVESEPDRGSRFWVELRVAGKEGNEQNITTDSGRGG